MPTKEWMTKKIFQKGMVDEKGEFVKHKGIEQKGKTKTISLLLHNFFRIWLFRRWCWKHLWCPLVTPLNSDGCLKFEHHEPLFHTHPNCHTELMKQQVSIKIIANYKYKTLITTSTWPCPLQLAISYGPLFRLLLLPNFWLWLNLAKVKQWKLSCFKMGIHLEKLREAIA